MCFFLKTSLLHITEMLLKLIFVPLFAKAPPLRYYHLTCHYPEAVPHPSLPRRGNLTAQHHVSLPRTVNTETQWVFVIVPPRRHYPEGVISPRSATPSLPQRGNPYSQCHPVIAPKG